MDQSLLGKMLWLVPQLAKRQVAGAVSTIINTGRVGEKYFIFISISLAEKTACLQ